MPESEGQQPKNNPFGTLGEDSKNKSNPPQILDNSAALSTESTNTFVQEVHDFQQQLELDYQKFERSLDERDTTSDLQTMDWEKLETEYNEEIAPCIAQENEIMEEFNARFAVRTCSLGSD